MVVDRRMIRLALTIVGVAGIPLTSYLSIKGHEKAKLAETKKEKIKCYIPAIISAIISGGCIIGRDIDANKEIAALATTATYAVANRDKLEKKLGEFMTEDELKKLKKDNAKEALVPTEEGCKKQNVEWTGYGTLKVLEGYTGRLFYSSMEKVCEAERILTKRYQDGEYICMNDFYHLLGVQETHYGHQWGWVPNEDYFPEWKEDNPLGFENTLVTDEEDNPMLLIEIYTYPMESWMEV